MKIGRKQISQNSQTYFIADIAANHDGSLNRAKRLITLCAKAGADAAKFQHFKAETIVSDKGFKNLEKKVTNQNGKRVSFKHTRMQVLIQDGPKNFINIVKKIVSILLPHLMILIM